MPEFLQSMTGNIAQQLGGFLPRLAASIFILLVGWAIAHWIGRVVRIVVSKTALDQRLSGTLSAGQMSSPSVVLGKVAFYLAMLFVLIGFFNALALPVVSQPLNSFLSKVFEYIPRVLGAVALALIAWGLARVAKKKSAIALEAINIDQRLADMGKDTTSVSLISERSTNGTSLGAEKIERTDVVNLEFDEVRGKSRIAIASDAHSGTLSKSLPEAAYWLVLLLFLPAILGVLGMNGLLDPIQSMFTKAMGYIPNILGATLLLLVGMLIAKLTRTIVTNLSVSLGVNRLADKVGLGAVLSERRPSDILGIVAYALILFPVLVASFDTLDIDAVTQPASQVLTKITSLIPGFLGALLILGISYFAAKIASGVVRDLLVGIGFNEFPKKLGIHSASEIWGVNPPSQLAGTGVLIMMMLLATMQALPMMGLDMLATQLKEFIGFAFQVLLGLAIMALGVYLAKQVAGLVRKSGIDRADRFATLSRIAIVVFSFAIGLQRMGLAPSIVNVAFGSLLGGIGLAAAIAFGWGGRDAAKRLIDRYVS